MNKYKNLEELLENKGEILYFLMEKSSYNATAMIELIWKVE